MTSIWGFLLCTLAASASAALLLIVKRLLADKLPPAWQAGVWGILLLRLALPFGLDGRSGRQVLLPLPLWIETLKTLCEQHLDSAYDSAYALTRVTAPVGFVTGAPRSVTDWLFLVYLAGAAAALARYLYGYFRLRQALRAAAAPIAAQAAQLARVCRQYGFPVPRAVRVAGLPTAFVCGVLRPVLALPETELDDKVLLHELVHLKAHDSAWSMVWCFFRAVHWCNPFLQVCFDRIGNDGEAACDQRVLERLEGEQRRDYGRILLSMSNEPYARAPGTSSLSNGGKNIARRIQSIVRFKRYPKGMALVAACIAVMLVPPLVWGAPADTPNFSSGFVSLDGSAQTARLLAQTRVARCTTLAGALDTYAKALLNNNRAYYLIASPPRRQQQFLQALQRGEAPLAEGELALLRPLFQARPYSWDQGFSVWDLALQPDGSYTGWLVFHWTGFSDEAAGTAWEDWTGTGQAEGDPPALPAQDSADAGADRLSGGADDPVDEDGTENAVSAAEASAQDRIPEEEAVPVTDANPVSAVCLLPIRAWQSDGGWQVEADGPGQRYSTTDYLDYTGRQLAAQLLPPLAVYRGSSGQGDASAVLHTAAAIRQSSRTDPGFFFGDPGGFDLTHADFSARFSQITPLVNVRYTQTAPDGPEQVQQAGLYTAVHPSAVSGPDGSDHRGQMNGESSGGSSDGDGWISHIYSPDADTLPPGDEGGSRTGADLAGDDDGASAYGGSGYLWAGSISDTLYLNSTLDSSTLPALPYGFTVQFYRNRTQQDVLLLTREG